MGRGVSELGQQPSSPRPSPPLVGGEGEVRSNGRRLNSIAVPPAPPSKGTAAPGQFPAWEGAGVGWLAAGSWAGGNNHSTAPQCSCKGLFSSSIPSEISASKEAIDKRCERRTFRGHEDRPQHKQKNDDGNQPPFLA